MPKIDERTSAVQTFNDDGDKQFDKLNIRHDEKLTKYATIECFIPLRADGDASTSIGELREKFHDDSNVHMWRRQSSTIFNDSQYALYCIFSAYFIVMASHSV